MRALRFTALASLVALLVACGGNGAPTLASNGATGPVSNTQPIIVSGGPTGEFANMMTTSVTICVPGTGACQTIPDVQVDTGSTGLRLLASAVTLALPAVAGSGGNYSECATFADGFVWGPLASADVQLAGEVAPSMSIQLIQDNGVGPAIPATCASQGTAEDGLTALGANGILGIGTFLQDCGPYCALNISPYFYTCTSGGTCTEAAISLALQPSNPAGFFAQDNNGVVLQLPAVAATGATSANGTMLFGIGTQTNNMLSTAAIGVPASGAGAGSFTAVYNGNTYANSFFDSGSAALYFDDSSIPTCPASTLSSLYCPGTAASLSATPISVALTGSNGATATASLTLANAQFLLTQANASTLNAFSNLGGPTATTLTNAFDFGVPSFFGNSVFTAFEQSTTPAGNGPYFAFQPYP